MVCECQISCYMGNCLEVSCTKTRIPKMSVSDSHFIFQFINEMIQAGIWRENQLILIRMQNKMAEKEKMNTLTLTHHNQTISCITFVNSNFKLWYWLPYNLLTEDILYNRYLLRLGTFCGTNFHYLL